MINLKTRNDVAELGAKLGSVTTLYCRLVSIQKEARKLQDKSPYYVEMSNQVTEYINLVKKEFPENCTADAVRWMLMHK